MSSLAASRADNFYIDPNRFDPSKRGRRSYNELANSHPLGKRAKKLKTEGVLIIRFELPNDVWCGKCNERISRGVRFNAEKKKIGMYFTTPIWEFTMPCPRCHHRFTIRTNPSQRKYDYVDGCRQILKNNVGIVLGDTNVAVDDEEDSNVLKDHDNDEEGTTDNDDDDDDDDDDDEKTENFMTKEDNRTNSRTVLVSSSSSTSRTSGAVILPVLSSSSSSSSVATSSIAKLEHKKLDELRYQNEQQRLQALYTKASEHYGKDRTTINSLARKINREERKELRSLDEEREKKGLPSSIQLGPATDKDIEEAKERMVHKHTDTTTNDGRYAKRSMEQSRHPEDGTKLFFIPSTENGIKEGDESGTIAVKRTPSQEIFQQTLQGASVVSNAEYSKVMNSSIFLSNGKEKLSAKERSETVAKEKLKLNHQNHHHHHHSIKEKQENVRSSVPRHTNPSSSSSSSSSSSTASTSITITDIIRQGLVLPTSSVSSRKSTQTTISPIKKLEAQQYILHQIQSGSRNPTHPVSSIRIASQQQGPQRVGTGNSRSTITSFGAINNFPAPISKSNNKGLPIVLKKK